MMGTRSQLLAVFGVALALFAPAAFTSHLYPSSIASGGTGQTTKAAAFDALQPMTTAGDIIYGGTSGTGTRLAKGADGTVLTLASGIPSWGSPSAGTLQATMTAGATSTVNATMSLNTTSQTALSATAAGNNAAIFAYSSGANGGGLSVENDNGSTEAQFFRFGSSVNNGPLIIARDSSTGGSNGDLLELQGDAGATERFIVGRDGKLTAPSEVSWSGIGTDGTGLFRRSSQTGTISATTTSTAVTFGATFAAAPVSVQVTPTSSPGTTLWWVSSITTTGFTLNETAGTTISYTYTATE